MSPIGKILLSLCTDNSMNLDLNEATTTVAFMLRKHPWDVRRHVRMVAIFLGLTILGGS